MLSRRWLALCFVVAACAHAVEDNKSGTQAQASASASSSTTNVSVASTSAATGGSASSAGGNSASGGAAGDGGIGGMLGQGGVGGMPVVMIYANYDGGPLVINVDSNEPNIKIGLVSYEALTVTIQGNVSHVSEVLYAGFNDVPGSTVSGVNQAIVSILTAPPATIMDMQGYPLIICNHSGGNGNQGGCNTKPQIQDYFTVTLGAPIAFHKCQYGVWTGVQNTSAGGTCT